MSMTLGLSQLQVVLDGDGGRSQALRDGSAAGRHFYYERDSFFFTGPVLEVDAPHHMVHVE